MRIAILSFLAALFVAGCGSQSGGHLTSGTLTHVTITHPYTTTDLPVTGVTIPVTTFSDLDIRETEAGILQEGDKVYVEGSIVDSTGTPLAGAQIGAFTDAGTSTGTILYRNVSGAIDPALTLSSPDGRFTIFNAAPGRLNLLCLGGGNGNLSVTAEANEILRCTITLSAPPLVAITHAGATLDGADNVEGGVTITAIGQGFPFPATSDSGGSFSFTSVPGETAHGYLLTKAGFLDTYTLQETGSVSLSSPAGDLQIFHPTERDDAAFKPASVSVTAATGILTGFARDSAGSLLSGAIVEVRDASGVAQGTVVYSDAGGNADENLSATTSSGEFTVFNVPPGTALLIGSTATTRRGMAVEVFADGITIVPTLLKLASATAQTISFSGITHDLQGVPQGNVKVTVIGGGTTTSNGDGNFTFPSLPANSELIFTAIAD
jgi:protocatechuate 3,4-dioxygenase beta subunit